MMKERLKIMAENEVQSTVMDLVAQGQGVTDNVTAIEKLKDDKKRYEEAHSIQSAEGSFVKCYVCCSRVNKRFLSTEKCPVCTVDLRSSDVLDMLKAFDDKIAELKTDITA